MFGVLWLILLWIASLAVAAAYRPHAPYSNTTLGTFISTPYPFATSVPSESTQSSRPVESFTVSSIAYTPLSNTPSSIRRSSLEPSPSPWSAITTSLITPYTTQQPPSGTPAIPLWSVSTPSPSKFNGTQNLSSEHPSNYVFTPVSSTHRSSPPPLHSVYGSSAFSSGYGLPRSSEHRAPYLVNGTGPVTSASGYGYPKLTGSVYPSWALNSTGKSRNSTILNTLCTVNVPSANVEWWYGATFWSGVGTFTRFLPNLTSYDEQYMTMVPNTQTGPFDVASAIASDFPYSEHATYDAEWDMTWTDYIPYTVTPAAATTSIVERDYVPTLPPGNYFPQSDIFSYLRPSSVDASVLIATAANASSAMTSATPFVYFSAYEVESETNGTTVTQMINLPQPTAIEYAIKGIEDSASASGTVPADLMQHIPQSTCVPGTFQGAVTVLVVLDLLYVYRSRVNPFIIHIESSVEGWGDDPIVVFQATPTGPGRLMTIDLDPEPTQGGAKETSASNPVPQSAPAQPPVSTPAVAGGASESPRPGNNSPGGSQNGASSSRGTSSGSGQPGGSQSGSGEPSGGQSGNSQSSGNSPGGGPSKPNVITSPRETVGSIGSNPVIVGPSSVVIVGSQTLQPGAAAVTVGGSVVSVVPSATAIVVNDHTSALPVVANPGSPSQTIGAIGGSPIVVGPSSVVVVGTQTLQPGGGAVLVNGSPISLVPSGNAVVVGSTTSNGHIIGTKTSFLPSVIFPTEPARAQPGSPPPVLTIGSSTLTANAATQFFIAPGQTLTPGGTATIDGKPVSLDSSAAFLVVAGSTQVLPTSPPSRATSKPEIVVGGSTITALPNNNAINEGNAANAGNDASGPTFIVSGQTLSPGRQIIVDGNTISLAPSGSFVVINGVTSTITNADASHRTPPPLTIGSNTLSALPGPGTTFAFGTQVLTPGGVITVDGTTVSLSPSTNAVVINGVTSTFETAAAARTTQPPLTLDGDIVTPLPGPGTSYALGDQILTPGGIVTVDGTTISLAPDATALVVNGVTTTLNPPAAHAASITNPPVLTIGSQTYTAAPGSGTSFVIDGQTLTLGGTLVVNGTTISLGLGATELVYGSAGRSTTEMLFPGTTTRGARTMSSVSASASVTAGSTGADGAVAPTMSAPGAGHGLRPSRLPCSMGALCFLGALLLL